MELNASLKVHSFHGLHIWKESAVRVVWKKSGLYEAYTLHRMPMENKPTNGGNCRLCAELTILHAQGSLGLSIVLELQCD